MDNILGDLRCLVYLDDMIAQAKTFELKLQRLTLIFSQLRAANLKLNSKKCALFQCRVKFLGHVVSEEGVATDPEKVVVVTNWPKPQNIRDVRSFHEGTQAASTVGISSHITVAYIAHLQISCLLGISTLLKGV